MAPAGRRAPGRGGGWYVLLLALCGVYALHSSLATLRGKVRVAPRRAQLSEPPPPHITASSPLLLPERALETQFAPLVDVTMLGRNGFGVLPDGAVEGIVHSVGSLASASRCAAACDASPTNCTAWTWHDSAQGSYALQCILREDLASLSAAAGAIWPSKGHFSGISLAGVRHRGGGGGGGGGGAEAHSRHVSPINDFTFLSAGSVTAPGSAGTVLDLSSFAGASFQTAQACGDACLATTQCTAWTWHDGSQGAYSNHCYFRENLYSLKDAANVLVASPGHVSGVVVPSLDVSTRDFLPPHSYTRFDMRAHPCYSTVGGGVVLAYDNGKMMDGAGSQIYRMIEAFFLARALGIGYVHSGIVNMDLHGDPRSHIDAWNERFALPSFKTLGCSPLATATDDGCVHIKRRGTSATALAAEAADACSRGGTSRVVVHGTFRTIHVNHRHLVYDGNSLRPFLPWLRKPRNASVCARAYTDSKCSGGGGGLWQGDWWHAISRWWGGGRFLSSSPHGSTQPLPCIDIAVHIRRGDTYNRSDLTWRFIPNLYFVRMANLLTRLLHEGGYPPPFITFFMDGWGWGGGKASLGLEDFDLVNAPHELILGGDVFFALERLSASDILITSLSSFSYLAAILHDPGHAHGLVLHAGFWIPQRDGWFLPLGTEGLHWLNPNKQGRGDAEFIATVAPQLEDFLKSARGELLKRVGAELSLDLER